MISLSIPVLDNLKYTRNILSNIIDCVEIPEEIFIIDDGSKEDIKGLTLEFKSLNIKYIRHNENMGYNYSCNEAIKLSTGDYISFFNNDMILNKYIFKKIRQTFKLCPNAGIICPTTISQKNIINQSEDSSMIKIKK